MGRSDDINIMTVFKAMGMASDQEIMHVIGADSSFTQLLLPTVQDCRKDGIATPFQALQFLGTRPPAVPPPPLCLPPLACRPPPPPAASTSLPPSDPQEETAVITVRGRTIR